MSRAPRSPSYKGHDKYGFEFVYAYPDGRYPGKFYASPDIGGQPAIYIHGPRLASGAISDCFFVVRAFWITAYWGAFWRNLLGSLYIPISPVKRRDIANASADYYDG